MKDPEIREAEIRKQPVGSASIGNLRLAFALLLLSVVACGYMLRWRADHRPWMTNSPPVWVSIATDEDSEWFLNTEMTKGAAIWKRVPRDNIKGRAARTAEIIHLTRLGVTSAERYASTHYLVYVACEYQTFPGSSNGVTLSIVRMDASDVPLHSAEIKLKKSEGGVL
jgi:hypothetical protein